MKIDVVFMQPATEFISSLPEKAQKKVVYNINRVRGGEMDTNLFKKLGESGIWEFRTIFNGICYRLLSFWEYRAKRFSSGNTWFCKKIAKDASERDRASKNFKN